MAEAATAVERRYGGTQRTDRWWVEPMLTGGGLLIFAIYTTISAALGTHWAFETANGTYLSPYFDPLITPGWLPGWLSPAIFILWAPLGFRTTCYYYRRSYYRAYFLSPPACAVREPARRYSGESAFPLVLQNVHRWFMYVALIIFVPALWLDAFRAYWLTGHGFGIGVGSIILTVNAFLLMMYTIGCHSLRHWVAGGLNQFSKTPMRRLRRRVWDVFTIANEHHRFWAWTSMIFVGVSDLYVHLVASGVITDLHTWTHPL